MRSSLYLQAAGLHLVVDTPPDFRMQALTYHVPRVDAVLFTHGHADHILGFDDIRRYNTIQNQVIPVYASPDTVADINRIFDYMNHDHPPGVYRPQAEFHPVTAPFDVGAVRVRPFAVPHARKITYGYRFDAEGHSVGYFPDCQRLSDEIVAELRGMDIMILDALRRKPHSTHLSLEESVERLGKIGARRSYLVHMCHDLDHETTQQSLPPSIAVAYDGLSVEC